MKFLFISEAGDSIGIAHRVLKEGNEVAIWIRDDSGSQRGDGLVPKIHEWGFEIDRDTIVVADCTGSGVLLDAFRQGGFFILGGSLEADRLEMDRRYAASIMKRCGIQVPKSAKFTDWETAYEYIKKFDGRLVFKPSGELSGNLPSFVSHDSEELLEMLEHFRQKFHGEPEFELQEFIEGVDISTEVWWCHDRPLLPYNHTLETKHLMDGDHGPSGGCTGNIVWADDGNRVTAATVDLLGEYLSAVDYVGPIDVNALVAEDGSGIYGLEFTPRFGYDATPTLVQTILRGDIGEFLSDCARGQARGCPLDETVGAAVRATVAPWPSEKYPGPEGLPVKLPHGRNWYKYFSPYDVMLKDDELVTCGAYGIVGLALGVGDDIEKAVSTAYQVLDKTGIPDCQFRTDLSEHFANRFKRIKSSF